MSAVSAVERCGPFAGQNVGRVWLNDTGGWRPVLTMPSPLRAFKVAAALDRRMGPSRHGTSFLFVRDIVDRLARVQRRQLGLCEDCGGEARCGCCS